MYSKKDKTKVNKFISFVKKECKKNGIKIILSKKKDLLVNDVKCSGYFSATDKELAVATGKPFKDWLEVFIHEYAHSVQYATDSKVWLSNDINGYEASELLDIWLNKTIDLSPIQLKKYTEVVMDVELDCEKRSVSLIKKFDLPIDIDLYIKKANSYVLSYHVVKKMRKWRKVPPYSVQEIVDAMPNHFNLNYKKPNKRLISLIEKKSFK